METTKSVVKPFFHVDPTNKWALKCFSCTYTLLNPDVDTGTRSLRLHAEGKGLDHGPTCVFGKPPYMDIVDRLKYHEDLRNLGFINVGDILKSINEGGTGRFGTDPTHPTLRVPQGGKKVSTVTLPGDPKQRLLGQKADGKLGAFSIKSLEGADISDERLRTMINELTIMVDGVKYSIVENPWFREFIHTFRPSFDFHSRYTVSKDIRRVMYIAYKQVIKILLARTVDTGTLFSATTDIWTAGVMRKG